MASANSDSNRNSDDRDGGGGGGGGGGWARDDFKETVAAETGSDDAKKKVSNPLGP